MDLLPAEPVSTLGYAGLRLAFHPDDAQGPNLPSLVVTVNDLSVDLLRGSEALRVNLVKPEWQVLEIPLEAFNLQIGLVQGARSEFSKQDTVGVIESIRIAGNLTGTFYLDDIRLVTTLPALPPPTAVVVEAGDGPTPPQFSLAQNYPNPFNNGTAIRFALPAPAPVRLVVYNLAGQPVATLVEGMHKAGVFTVRWDGLDGAGQALATGVYLYHLQAGEQVETRKLLLVH